MSRTDDLSEALNRAAGRETRSKRGAVPPRNALLLRLDPALMKRLKHAPIKDDVSVRRLGEEALDVILTRFGGGSADLIARSASRRRGAGLIADH